MMPQYLAPLPGREGLGVGWFPHGPASRLDRADPPPTPPFQGGRALSFGDGRWLSPSAGQRRPQGHPRISPTLIALCPPIESDLHANPLEAMSETRRKSRKSPKIPLRPRMAMIDGG